MKLHTVKTFICSGLLKYSQIILTFNNDFVLTYCTSVFRLNFLYLFLHGKEAKNLP